MVWDTAAMAQQITDRRLPGVEPEIPRKVISGQVGDSLAALVSPSARVELEGLHDGCRLLEHALEVGMIPDPGFPSDMDAWSRELKELRAVAFASRVAPRPLLVVHGSDDDLVPVFDARVLVDAHGSAELRIMNGAGHRLRHDPRAIAVLLGWLDRQRHRRD